MAELKDIIEHLQPRINSHNPNVHQKIAVFDLDNTLLIGDIGDAVFAQLKKYESEQLLTIQQKPMPLEWQEYRHLIHKGKQEKAYKRVVTCMAGLPLNTLLQTTRNIIHSTSNNIHINGDTVPVPTVNPTLYSLIRYLKKKGFRIFIISASNHYSVRMIARELFDLPETSAFG
ncbi:MAG: HAD family hydrolase, partial [Candidatus Aminicenantes bacterium]|nr:HAD family hydrolase [Candidatus Aminicenantes bacterium]